MMGEYPENYEQEPVFGLGWSASGIVYGSAEGLRVTSIGRIMGAMLGALGVGIYQGGVGSIVGLALQITEVGWTAGEVLVPGAVIEDALGAVPVHHAAAELAASAFPTGVSYVHLQVGETAREDLGSAYYVDASEVPAPDALLVCKVTKAGGALTAVDNSVRAAPAIAGRIPWAELVRDFGDVEGLEEFLSGVLGAEYLGETPPDDVDARLTALEEGGGGGGAGGTPLLDELVTSGGETDLQVAEGAAAAAVEEHVEELHAPPGDGAESTTLAAEQWDSVPVCLLRGLMQIAHYLADDTDTLRDAMVVVETHCGAEFVDEVNSTF